jgi:hypothetical protein
MTFLSTSVTQATGFLVKVSANIFSEAFSYLILTFPFQIFIVIVMGFMYFNDKYTDFINKKFSTLVIYVWNFKGK